MRPVKAPGHTFFITVQSILHQFVRCFQDTHHLRPAAHAHGILEFSPDLLIWNKRLLRLGVIAKIADMDQQCKNIILRPEIAHIILKAESIDPYPFPAEHLHNIRL